MSWILILMVGSSLTTATFHDGGACHRAGVEAKAAFWTATRFVTWVCVADRLNEPIEGWSGGQ